MRQSWRKFPEPPTHKVSLRRTGQWIPSYCRDSERVCSNLSPSNSALQWITKQLVTNISATLTIFLSFVFVKVVNYALHEASLRSINDPPWNATQWMTVQDVLNHLEGPPWSITRQSKGFWGPSLNISSSSTHILELKGPWYESFPRPGLLNLCWNKIFADKQSGSKWPAPAFWLSSSSCQCLWWLARPTSSSWPSTTSAGTTSPGTTRPSSCQTLALWPGM